MRPFHYNRVETVEEALAAFLSRDGERSTSHADAKSDSPTIADPQYLGGGTDLIELVKLDVRHPTAIVDVHRVESMRQIQSDDDGSNVRGGDVRGGVGEGGVGEVGWTIGAAVRMHELAVHEGVAASHRLIGESLRMGATPQIRHLATLGGNVLQRTRCPYFRMAVGRCNRRVPGSGCMASAGDHSMLAIWGTSPDCLAVHPSDFAVALVAAAARVQLVDCDGERRTVDVGELHRLPGAMPIVETVLRPGELIESFYLPPHPGGGAAYAKFPAAGFARASAAVTVGVQDDRVAAVRVALGGVATVPWRARHVEEVLIDALGGNSVNRSQRSIDLPLARRAVEAELAAGGADNGGADTSGGRESAVPLLVAMVAKAATLALQRAGGSNRRGKS